MSYEFIINYENKDITADISPMLLSLTYTDNEHGKSDELELELEDSQSLWRTDWYPGKGETLSVFLGRKGQKLLRCGIFEIDEITFSGGSGGERLGLKAIGTGFQQAVRQRNYKTFQDSCFGKIVRAIAAKHGLSVVGDINDVAVQKSVQNGESDLHYLLRLAERTGHVFKINGETLVFYQIKTLEASDSVFSLSRADAIDYSLSSQSLAAHGETEVSEYNPQTGATYQATSSNTDGMPGKERLTGYSESPEQTMAAAEGAKKSTLSGRISLPGNEQLVAGINAQLEGFGKLNGKYHAEKVSHRIDRGGYVTELEIRKI
ncbi:late control D family protein [Chloroherpeton thalassium ATCC 35110]|uniref:Late control D family protein n=1 Tax=Chloroherpeton thalassium (strain ATCC 35110 / GB-78) TaxID=517418 RepID=B3QTI7_CHLT3|nr:contractile injection system protein, VgrG/Pvc8 family [Chloroherpeton thalassium]ACF12733.1 late control D family protein [Chloroherpeton thalassium ATCC 35110]